MISDDALELLGKLSEVSQAGPLPAIGGGSTSVGMTLLDALGIAHTSLEKPKYKGIVVTARRNLPAAPRNRVNLFARVPDWGQSACRSSAEIVERHGYEGEPGVKRLYCTVRSRHPNSQGLFLMVDRERGTLEEMALTQSGEEKVVTWHIADLKRRLTETHPESIWVSANVMTRDGAELFHYRKAIYTGLPMTDQLESLLIEGTVTVDHLIEKLGSSTQEKGPLFKIVPSNLPLLFPSSDVIDLLTFRASSGSRH